METKLRFIYLLCLYLFISTAPAFASGNSDIFLRLFTTDHCSIQNRQETAKLLRVYFQEVEDSFPNLTPMEENWLNDELQTNNSERGKNALQSREFHLREIKQYAKGSIGALEYLSTNTTTAEKIKEVNAWSAVASNMLYEAGSYNLDFLSREGFPELANKLKQRVLISTDCKTQQCYSQGLTMLAMSIVNIIKGPLSNSEQFCKESSSEN